MKALTNKRDSFKRAACLLVSFTLAFSLFGSPAYAFGLDAAEADEVAAEATQEQAVTASVDSLSAGQEVNESLAADNSASDESEIPGDESETVQPSDGEEGSAGNGSDEEEQDPLDETEVGEAPYTVTMVSTYDAANNSIAYTVTIKNPTENACDNIQLSSSVVIGEEEVALDLPYTVSLPEMAELVFDCQVVLPATVSGDSVQVSATVSARYENWEVSATCFDSCTAPKQAYEVDYTSTLLDAQGNAYTDADEHWYAIPGDMVAFSFTVKNTGTVELKNVSLESLTPALVPDGDLDWASPITIPVGQSVTFSAYYIVSYNDVLVDSYGLVGVTLAVTVDGTTTVNEEPYYISKVDMPLYRYTINYYTDSVSEENLITGSYTSEPDFFATVKLTDALLNRNLPDGYKPLSAEDMQEITLFEDSSRNVINVVYSPVDAFNYYIRYFVGSTDSDPVAIEMGSARLGSLITVDEALANAHKPLEGYVSASSASFVVTDNEESNTLDIVYQPEMVGYTINYSYEVADGIEAPIGSEQGEASFGTLLTVSEDDMARYIPSGYVAPSSFDECKLGMNSEDNVLNVVFKRGSFGYTINFYRDEVAEDNLVASEEGVAVFGSILSVEQALIDRNTPAGYQAVDAVDVPGITVSVDASQNIINVVYDRANYNFVIKYYLDEVDRYDWNLVGTETLTGSYEQSFSLSAEFLNKYMQDGYKQKNEGIDVKISADPENNVLIVVYDRDEFDYYINYYHDSADPENLIETMSGKLAFGSPLVLPNSIVNRYCPAGYDLLEGNRSIEISATSANVIDIVYQKQSTISYTVNYYVDSVSADNLCGSDSGWGTLGDQIPFTNGKFVRDGYSAQGEVSGATTIGADGDNNVLNVVYPRDRFAFTVNFYKDSVEEANFLGSQQGEGLFMDAITYEAAFLPVGYSAQDAALVGATIIGSQAENNVLNVVYSKETRLSYRVNYYADSVDGVLLGSYEDFGTFGDEIPYDAALHLQPGYLMPQVFGATTIGAAVDQNVLNVVYPRASFGYTVNYYKDEISPDNLLGSVSDEALYGSNIPYLNSAYIPEGYSNAVLLSGQTTVSYDEGQNVLNVVYVPGRFMFSIDYYKGSIDQRNLIASVPQDARLFNSLVELSADELNLQLPEGYAPLTQGASLRITADVDQNVINVVYTPTFDEFYEAGIEPLNATYDGSRHYLTPKGVFPGDIITYTYNGETHTRVVGADGNFGVAFEDATDGDLPVSITLTRAGITSRAIQAIVNIAPSSNISAGNEPASTPNDSALPSDYPQQDVVILPNVVTGVTSGLEQFIPADLVVPSPTYAVPEGLLNNGAQDATSNPEESGTAVIEDDLNPLASSPLSTHRDLQQSSSPIGWLLFVIATLFAAAVAFFAGMRSRVKRRYASLKGTSLAIEHYKVKHITAYIVLLSVVSAVFYVLWIVFRI